MQTPCLELQACSKSSPSAYQQSQRHRTGSLFIPAMLNKTSSIIAALAVNLGIVVSLLVQQTSALVCP